MSSFEDRKKSFEKKFAHDEELQFKISARKNKYIAEWVSGLLGFEENKKNDLLGLGGSALATRRRPAATPASRRSGSRWHATARDAHDVGRLPPPPGHGGIAYGGHRRPRGRLIPSYG